MDELFAAKLWAWQFKKYETHETGRALVVQANEIKAEETTQIDGHEIIDSDMKVC